MNGAVWLSAAIAYLALFTAVVFCVTWLRIRQRLRVVRDEAERWEDRYEALGNLATESDHYEVEISDWGPEYTGQDGTLPRYRWVVRDPMYWIKVCTGATDSNQDWLMLGNAATPQQALVDAYRWIEGDRSPKYSVEVAEHGQRKS